MYSILERPAREVLSSRRPEVGGVESIAERSPEWRVLEKGSW